MKINMAKKTQKKGLSKEQEAEEKKITLVCCM
jgi:hypothetical protein